MTRPSVKNARKAAVRKRQADGASLWSMYYVCVQCEQNVTRRTVPDHEIRRVLEKALHDMIVDRS